MSETDDGQPGNFLADIVDDDMKSGATQGRLVTRFPPEPSGYLHIGHAKSICLNFGLAARHPVGKCNLRFDDTNPANESVEFVESMKRDIRWLGFDWEDREFFASDYFEQLYEWAVQLIHAGKAYVDERSDEEIRATRGDFHTDGQNSPFRDRPVAENLERFAQMRAGEFDDGAMVLRAKIDMQSKDLKLRDPLLYRIKRVSHHRTGDEWCIYPMYDWAHGQSDAIEGVTHSICTLEFINHRGLYEWFLEALNIETPPKQIEFGRLNLNYTITSKRKLQKLVAQDKVCGWDDPRMPTVAGYRRRGYTPESIRNFMDRIGVSKNDGVVDVGLLEHEVREHLNATSPRRMAVLRPLKLVITNFPEDEEQWFELPNHPADETAGTRPVPLSREVYVEQTDFMEEAPKKWWRLAPGREVRLRGAALVTVQEVVKADDGKVVELRCTWDPDSAGGAAADGRKVKGTIHWVSARHAIEAEIRLYDRLFRAEEPGADGDFMQDLNPESLEALHGCMVEPSIEGAEAEDRYQFERTGYFVVDTESRPGALVFNRTIALKDSWAKRAK